MTGDYLQEFRVVTASSSTPINDSTIFIPSRPDKAGERIVLWRDIQSEIKNADRVRNGKTLVVFMTGDDFEELTPRRIPYHPEVVLDVVVASQGHKAAVISESSEAAPGTLVQDSAQKQTNAATRNLGCPVNHGKSDVASEAQHINNLSTVAMDILERSLVVQSAILEREEQKSLQRYDHLPTTYLEGELAGMHFQNLGIGDHSMNQPGMMEGTGTNNNNAYQMYTINLMHQMLNRQVILENRIQAVMTQNYELHEYPIPRMFIVLPKPKKRKDKMTHPLSKQFRLYFLCECGDHTIGTDRSNLPNKIHLARHEGYDLDQPNEFFERYGSYVLAIMKFLKYGAMAAGTVVPPLALFKVVEGLDAIQKSLTSTMGSIESLMEETIKHIHDLQGNTQGDGATAMGPMRLDDIEALEGADLRQLQLYLNGKDKGRILGDLFRIFTPEGHVKWVCIDHYKENYRKAAMQRLEDVAATNKGYFNPRNGYVRIKLASGIVAKQFYEAMINARGIHGLCIELQWDATLDDLRSFASAVTKANIIKLDMKGEHFKGPVLDMINNGCRYNPILELMCNGRVQEMTLSVFDKFYQRIDVSSMTTTFGLQILHLGTPLDFGTSCYSRPSKSILAGLLKRCPRLTYLEVAVTDLNEAFEDLTPELSILPCLKMLVIQKRPDCVTMDVSQGNVQAMKASLFRLGDLLSEASLLQKGGLTELRVYSTFREPNVPQLANVMLWNPKLHTIGIKRIAQRSLAVVDAIASAREKILSEGGSCGLKLAKIHCKFPSVPYGFSVTFEFRPGTTAPTLSGEYTTRSMPDPGQQDFLKELLRHCWSVRNLNTDYEFDDEQAAILDNATEENGSEITSLSLNTRKLTTVGTECMVRVIERSHDLQQLRVVFENLHEGHEQKKLEQLVSRYGKIITELTLKGSSADVWIPRVMALCPTRLELPVLESLRLNSDDKGQLSPACVQWITAMASPPPRIPTSSSGSTQSDIISISEASAYEGSLLSVVELLDVPLQPDDWGIVIKALDYSALRRMEIRGHSFAMDHFKLLVDCVPVNSNPVGELGIYLDSPLIENGDELNSQTARLRGKLPNVEVHGRGSMD